MNLVGNRKFETHAGWVYGQFCGDLGEKRDGSAKKTGILPWFATQTGYK